MSFTEDERQLALTYAINGAMFMFRACENLSSEVMRGGPCTVGMVEFIQPMLMTREWINLDNETVIKYCNGTIDSKNKYIFDNSDIKVIPERLNFKKTS